MERFVCLLRGVNVGGPGTRLAMAAFRAALEGIGCADVATYIQSGNAVFRAEGPADGLAAAVTAALTLPNGTRPSCFILPFAALETAYAANPFPQAEPAPQSLHLVFLDRPVQPDEASLRALAAADEEFATIGAVFYLYAPSGVGRSRLAQKMGRHFGGAGMTARNLATVKALIAMARALPG